MRRFATLREWLSWQEALHPRSIELGLDRVRGVARALGVDVASSRVVTVAGTNGKGSCVALLEAILEASGRKVGTFTSPHLHRYNERIRIAGREVDDRVLMDAFERIDDARGEVSLTFFEFNTLAALLAFRDSTLDVLVLEVGLGGRLDAVNVVDADVAMLTSVDLDHMDWLGSSLDQIGREKAGIFRPGRPAILGRPDMPQAVLEEAGRVAADVWVSPRDFEYHVSRAHDSDTWNWRGRTQRFEGLPAPRLPGEHQLDNAAAVLAALEALGEPMPSVEQVAAALGQVKLSGRFEVIPGDVEWIFDVAHNPAAARKLAVTLTGHGSRGARPASGRTLAVVGILRDKDAAGILAALEDHVDEWFATDLPGPRGLQAEELRASGARKGGAQWRVASDVASACEQAARRARPGDRIVVFGSFHTVGPALEWRARH
jgi:dihydrofolate synthase / folylpolyglutamate synthase